jgi:hypothetical protein
MQQSAAAQEAKPENTKERTIHTESIELYFQQGSSDKVYHSNWRAFKNNGPSTLNGDGAVLPYKAIRR